MTVSVGRTSLTGMHIKYYNSRPTATLTNETISGRAADQQPPINIQPYTTTPHTLYTMTDTLCVDPRRDDVDRNYTVHVVRDSSFFCRLFTVPGRMSDHLKYSSQNQSGTSAIGFHGR